MAGGIRRYFSGGAAGAVGRATTTTATGVDPSARPYNERRAPPAVGATDPYSTPGLPRGVWINDFEFVPLPSDGSRYAVDANGASQMYQDRCAYNAGLPAPQGPPPKIVAIDPEGHFKPMQSFRPHPTPAAETQDTSSTCTELHRTVAQGDFDYRGF